MKLTVLIFVFTSILIVMRSDLFVDTNSPYFDKNSKRCKGKKELMYNQYYLIENKIVVPFVHGSISWWLGNGQQQSNMYDWKGEYWRIEIMYSLYSRSEWRGFVNVH